jgi:hypothetical protein
MGLIVRAQLFCYTPGRFVHEGDGVVEKLHYSGLSILTI